MKTATLSEIKKELLILTPDKAAMLCLRMARFRKENKELLTYLLFESHDEQSFVADTISMITYEFDTLPNLSVYYLKKSIRRILKLMNKHIKYSGHAITEVTLRIHFCQQMQAKNIPMGESKVLMNIYQLQLKKIQSVLAQMEEDLRYDYQSDLEKLMMTKPLS